MRALCLLLVLGIAGCAAVQPTPTPPVLALPPIPTASVLPGSTPAPPARSSTAVPATVRPATAVPATPVPPRLLLDRDPARPIDGFGPSDPAHRWLVTRTLSATDQPRFGLISLVPQQTTAITNHPGVPLGWSADGTLLLYADPGVPETLLAILPTIALTTTVLTATQGNFAGLIWAPIGPLTYASVHDDRLRLHTYSGPERRAVLAQWSQRTLVEDGLLPAPDGRSAALLLRQSISPTLELYRIDLYNGQSVLLDQGPPSAARPGLLWTPQGDLLYRLGADLRRFEPARNRISSTGLLAQPLDWLGGGALVRRDDDGALLRWTPETTQPFETGSGPLRVVAAQAGLGADALLLIDGQVWQVTIP